MPEVEVTSIRVEKAVVSPVSIIFIIDCLTDRDKQSGRFRYEGIRDTLMELSPEEFENDLAQVNHESCSSRDDWATTVNRIFNLCQSGHRPFVFIDGHGDEIRGLRLSSGEFISWEEYELSLIQLVLSAQGELAVFGAFCYSYTFVDKIIKRSVNQLTKLPFAFYYGYKCEVPTSVVEEETRAVYESLLRDGGQSLDFGSFQFSCYSEYEHAIQYVAPTIMMQLAPKTLVSMVPGFSKNHMRRALEVDLAKNGFRLGRVRHSIRVAINSPQVLAEHLLELTMHKTERRKRFISSILVAMSFGLGRIYAQSQALDA